MSVLNELIRERKEWPQRRRAAVRHQHLVMMCEATLGVEFLVVLCLYREVVDRIVQLLLR